MSWLEVPNEQNNLPTTLLLIYIPIKRRDLLFLYVFHGEVLDVPTNECIFLIVKNFIHIVKNYLMISFPDNLYLFILLLLTKILFINICE